MPGVSEWLRRESRPRNLYELLGHPLLDPDRDALLASLRSANRELLDYQSHDDAAIAKRAMALITELGRARGILEDRAKHQAYDDELIVGLRQEFARERNAGLVRSEDELANWLMARHGLDHFFASHVAKRVRPEPEPKPPPVNTVFRSDPVPVSDPLPPTVPAPRLVPRAPSKPAVENIEESVVPLTPVYPSERQSLHPVLLVLPWAVAVLALIVACAAAFVASRRSGDAEEARGRASRLETERDNAMRELSGSRDKLRLEREELTASAGRNLAEAERYKKQAAKKQDEVERLERQIATLGDGQAEIARLEKQIADDRKAKADEDAALRRFHRANDFYSDRMDDRALTEVTEAIRLNPKLTRALVLRGHLRYARREDTKALQDYDAAVRSDPQDARAILYRGNVRFTLKDYDLAIADYTESIRLEPDSASAYTNRGRARSRLNDFDPALADFNEALRLNPKYALAYHDRGWNYVMMKDFDKGLRDLNQAIQLDPKDSGFHYDKACLFALQKKSDLAFESLQQAFDLGYRNLQHMDTDADLDSIRGDPRYKRLLDKYRK